MVLTIIVDNGVIGTIVTCDSVIFFLTFHVDIGSLHEVDITTLTVNNSISVAEILYRSDLIGIGLCTCTRESIFKDGEILTGLECAPAENLSYAISLSVGCVGHKGIAYISNETCCIVSTSCEDNKTIDSSRLGISGAYQLCSSSCGTGNIAVINCCGVVKTTGDTTDKRTFSSVNIDIHIAVVEFNISTCCTEKTAHVA